MHIIKLNAIDSTNTYLKKISTQQVLEDYTVVTANYQTKGKGQMGAVWQSDASKNLMCSVFKRNGGISLEQHFYVSIVTSLAIIKSLEKFQVPKLTVKWPNDILSEEKKICGILIENVIKNNNLEASIMGIGLNANQSEFNDLPRASSLKIITGKFYALEELLQHILAYLKHYFSYLEKRELHFLKTEYESYLFRKNKPSTFKDKNGATFCGFIKSINDTGTLNVLIENDLIKTYELKDIELMY